MYKALWKKEWQESFLRFMIILAVLALAYISVLILAYRDDALGILIGIVAVGIHVVFLFLQWSLSFHGEWKSRTQWTWLNIPAPAWQLVTAKLGVGFVQYLLSVLLMTGAGFWTLDLYSRSGNSELADFAPLLSEAIWTLYPLLFTFLTLLSVALGLLAVFVLLMAKSWLPFGAVTGIVAAVAAVYGWFQFTGTAVYEFFFRQVVLFDAGARLEQIANGGESREVESGGVQFSAEVNSGSAAGAEEAGVYLYAFELAFEVLVIIGIVALLAWILDRLVEA
ncbi:hypothetical protein [Salisediminibacterium halotolerans]|uniref:ABC-2 type transport system permease protein n=1 Tax=Salisediminibacterium halotolerans TaxID=517425 RepID=A0A1H9WTP3_9BACI|nr:hypothetical protein [Salisediminibacterium haloalkalitolerans]SES37320.1 hypothetical protein SAMN05444126_1486 [Salisediminibacterium haloalkalitolerans]